VLRWVGRSPAIKFWSIIGVAGLLFSVLLYHVATVAHDHQVSYDTYLSITLTALAVLLAVVGVLVAVLAVWGYRTLCDEAGKVASNKAETAIREYLSKENVGERVRALVLEHVKQEGDKVYNDLSLTGQTGESKVGEEYPGEPGEKQPGE
jgi:H+/Cl- antiporter ClcA